MKQSKSHLSAVQTPFIEKVCIYYLLAVFIETLETHFGLFVTLLHHQLLFFLLLSSCLSSSVLWPTAACCFLYFFLINNIIPIFKPLVASPSVTSVRQEESNYWILPLRSACLRKSPSCFPAFFYSWSDLRRQNVKDNVETKDRLYVPDHRGSTFRGIQWKLKWGLLFWSREARFESCCWETYRKFYSPLKMLLSAKQNLPVLKCHYFPEGQEGNSACIKCFTFT